MCAFIEGIGDRSSHALKQGKTQTETGEEMLLGKA